MAFDQVAVNALISATVSHAQATGVFRSVNGHEPKAAPGSGLRAAIWAQSIRPVGAASGLSATSGVVTLNVRVYGNMLQKPEDEIDPALLAAVSLLMDEYTGDFTFGGTIRNIDLLGEYGEQLQALAGYLELAGAMYRVMTLTVPCVINDLWVQGGIPSAEETPGRSLQVDSLGVTGGASIGGTLDVDGETTLGGGLAVTDGATFDALAVSGAATAASLAVSGAASAASLAVSGDFTSAGFLTPAPGPVSRIPAWRTAAYAQIFQTGHGWTATGAGVGSSNLNDTSTFCKGTQSATITTAGTGVKAAFFRHGDSPSHDLTGSCVRLTFKIDNVAHLNYILLYVGTSSLANYFLWQPHTHSATAVNWVQSGEWVSMTIPWANVQSAAGTYSVSSAGVPSVTSGFTDWEVGVVDDGIGTVTMHLQAVEVIPDTAMTFPNGVVSVVFDDSFADVYTYARPVMDTYGYRGTTYNIAQAVGAGGSMTVAQLQQMQDMSGWEIGGHAYTAAAHNAGYQTLTAAQVNDEMRFLRSWMLNNGFPLDSFAYPLGNYSSTTDGVPIDQICSQYFSNGRSIISELHETHRPAMPFRMRSKTGISSAGTVVSTIAATGGPLDRCLNDGSWYIVTLHDIITGSPTLNTQISQADFSTLMAAINSRGIPVLPVGDVLRNFG